MVVITDPACVNYHAAGHPERPERVSRTVAKLRERNSLAIQWTNPSQPGKAQLLRAHSEQHLARLEQPLDFDADTAYFPGIADRARTSAGAALNALGAARAGNKSFSLMRPPGHHATRDQAMGFCYLNSIAVAALEAAATGARVAVFDFDVHHGNGTEAILRNRPGVAFFSIHQYPCYPGTGLQNVGDNCFNFPVAPRTPRNEYRKVFESALAGLKRLKPDVVGVSAGFDAYARDPLAEETLEVEDYHWLGTSLAALGKPVFSVLEGGYSDDLPELIFAYLSGLDS